MRAVEAQGEGGRAGGHPTWLGAGGREGAKPLGLLPPATAAPEDDLALFVCFSLSLELLAIPREPGVGRAGSRCWGA